MPISDEFSVDFMHQSELLISWIIDTDEHVIRTGYKIFSPIFHQLPIYGCYCFSVPWDIFNKSG